MSETKPLDLAQLKAQHGEIASADFPDGTTIVFRRPKRFEYEIWQDSKDKDMRRSQSALQLAQACLVSPGYAEFLAALEQCPGALLGPDGILDALVGMAGGLGDRVVVKKV